MTAIRTTRLSLATGVTLKLAFGGTGEPVLFLHGFPESHRTWRHQITNLVNDFQVVAPDQRGYGGSDKPAAIADYRVELLCSDVLALADALGIDRFTLVGHDWGGALAWNLALKRPRRLKRLAIVNAPHPYLFQRALIEDPEQRAASQYIRWLRSHWSETAIRTMGYETFFDRVIAASADRRKLPARERQHYLDDWSKPGALTGMINWYRAARIVVPARGIAARLPLWCRLPFPRIEVPTLVVWGLRDKALLPGQFEGLGRLVPDLRIVTEAAAGHFLPWERPDVLNEALRRFIAETPLPD